MHGIGFEFDLQLWFDFKVPKTTIPAMYIHSCIAEQEEFKIRPNAKIVWLGSMPVTYSYTKTKKKKYMGIDAIGFSF